MLNRHIDYTKPNLYTDTTPHSFPVVVTVKAYMLLVFRNRIHTRDNPCIQNGAEITLLGKAHGRYIFTTADGFVGECTADAFEAQS